MSTAAECKMRYREFALDVAVAFGQQDSLLRRCRIQANYNRRREERSLSIRETPYNTADPSANKNYSNPSGPSSDARCNARSSFANFAPM
jgi:hypothetical protein